MEQQIKAKLVQFRLEEIKQIRISLKNRFILKIKQPKNKTLFPSFIQNLILSLGANFPSIEYTDTLDNL